MYAPKLKNQVVRDLAWMLFSPPLIDLPPESKVCVLWPARDLNADALRLWLSELDANPAELISYLETLKSPRLGIYFEGLCGFFFRSFPDFTLIAQNLQVNRPTGGNAKQTLGEFDFIVQHGSQTLHIETAVKFYLGTGDQGSHTSAQYWIGPNANDRLDKKVDRLQSHQLALGEWAEGKAELAKLGVSKITVCLLMAGYLFYPLPPNSPVPSIAHPAHNKGHWLTQAQILELCENPGFDDHGWHFLDKQLWLSPAKLNDDILNREQLSAAIKEYFSDENALSTSDIHAQRRAKLAYNPRLSHRPILLTRLSLLADGRTWEERARYFVVPNYWPATATPLRNT